MPPGVTAAMKEVYRAGVVGAGAGGTLNMRALDASGRYQLVAVADVRDDALVVAKEAYPEIETYGDHGEMLSEQELDVVCVATWPPTHREIVEDALQVPLEGIVVEKPLADNWRDGLAIVEQVRARGLPIAVPHGLLVADHGRQILEVVRDGQIGQLKLVEVECTGWDIINAGIHWLNYVLALAGGEQVAWVMAACDTHTRTYRDQMQVETVAVTYAQLRDGMRIVMHTGDEVDVSAQGKGTLFRLVGTKGLLEFYGWEPRYRLLNDAHPDGELVEVSPGPLSGHQRHLEHMALEMDRGTPDYVVAESSLAALEVVDAAYLSCRCGCQVTLPLSTFTPPEPSHWMPGRPYGGEGGGRDGRRLS
jgi:predicted dehydrogenase